MLTRNQVVSFVLYGGFVLSILLGFPSHRGRADEATSVKKSIEGQYVQMETLLTKHDVTGYMKLLTPTYTHRSLNGETWNRATFEDVMQKVYQPLQKDAPPAKPADVPIPFPAGSQMKSNQGDTGEIVTTQITRFQMKANQVVDEQITIRDVPYTTPEGDKKYVRIINHSEDIWIKSDTVWMLQSCKDLKVDAKLFKNKQASVSSHK